MSWCLNEYVNKRVCDECVISSTKNGDEKKSNHFKVSGMAIIK